MAARIILSCFKILYAVRCAVYGVCVCSALTTFFIFISTFFCFVFLLLVLMMFNLFSLRKWLNKMNKNCQHKFVYRKDLTKYSKWIEWNEDLYFLAKCTIAQTNRHFGYTLTYALQMICRFRHVIFSHLNINWLPSISFHELIKLNFHIHERNEFVVNKKGNIYKTCFGSDVNAGLI